MLETAGLTPRLFSALVTCSRRLVSLPGSSRLLSHARDGWSHSQALLGFSHMLIMISTQYVLSTVQTKWLPSVRLRHFSPTCAVHIEDCEGWWLSGCRSSVAERLWLKPGVLGPIPGYYWPFHFPLFLPQTSLLQHEAGVLSVKPPRRTVLGYARPIVMLQDIFPRLNYQQFCGSVPSTYIRLHSDVLLNARLVDIGVL